MMDPTVKGTMNVLKACSAMNVEKLILVSSAASICFNPDWPEDKLKDESCWSDKEFCKKNKVRTEDSELLINSTSTTKFPKRLKSIMKIKEQLLHHCTS